MDDLEDLAWHLTRSTELDFHKSKRLIEEVVNFFQESPEDYVCRRHRELKATTEDKNDALFVQISQELEGRCFAAPQFSKRQIRRIIYG